MYSTDSIFFYSLGDLKGDKNDFGHTTLANLDPFSLLLWVHISMSFFLFPLSIFTMRRFSVNLNFTKTSLEISRTLMVEKIPKGACEGKEKLMEYLKVNVNNSLICTRI